MANSVSGRPDWSASACACFTCPRSVLLLIPGRSPGRRHAPGPVGDVEYQADRPALADAVRGLRWELCRCGGLSVARLTTTRMSWSQADTDRLDGLDNY
jgi:hypothetical protein